MRNHLLLAMAMSLTMGVYAQPSLATLSENSKKQRQEHPFTLKLSSPTQGALQFNPSSRMMKTDVKAWLQSSLGMRAGKDQLQKAGMGTRYVNTLEIEKYQQYFAGIKVEHGFVNVISKAGKVAAVQMEFYPLPETMPTAPKLTGNEALAKATAYIGAAKYVWEGYTGSDPELKKPTGLLVMVEDYYKKQGRLHLAYKFEIYAEQPLSRSYVYVSAIDGSVLLVDRIIKHYRPDLGNNTEGSRPSDAVAGKKSVRIKSRPFLNTNGTAQTRYSSAQAIIADDGNATPGKPFQLRQLRNGHNILTLNYERRLSSAVNDALAVDFTDNDNDWTTEEHKTNYDDAALDVQHAMQYISDYWKTVHNRDSWDNTNGQMKSYVHVRGTANAGFDNAFWSGSAMYYGDGSYFSATGDGTVSNINGFKPLTSLDVSAHELGHAITQATASLIYQRESGGLNEGFSDIWAACVENYSGLAKSPFLVGEEITPGGALRNMQNPKQYNSPDTYGGTYWHRTSLAACAVPGQGNDNCGVHFNSGVLNKWFYLITQGGTGTNDMGDMYNIGGLGFAKTEQIAYLTELSLTPNATYAAARTAAINAATILFGACSNEVMQVTNAWFAVGVGQTANCTPVVEFVKTKASVAEGPGLAGNCSTTQLISIPVKLASQATQNTGIQFSFGGTAVPGVHYTVTSPVVTFAAGENGTKNLELTILDNSTTEINKTVIIGYTIVANGGNATAGLNNQSCTLTITNDDLAPSQVTASPVTTVTLLSENFESSIPGTTFPSLWNATLAFSGGSSATNQWAIGPNAGTGIAGNAAYISNTAAGALDYAYTNTSTTDRLLRLPPLNTTGLKDIRLQFTYKTGGEAYEIDPAETDPAYWASLWDFGRILFDANGSGTSFSNLFDTPANDFFAFYDNSGNPAAKTFAPFSLPAAVENKPAVYLGFRWTSDNADGNGIPWAIDDIIVTGRTAGASVETADNASNSVRVFANSADTYIASGGSNLLTKLSNVSDSIHCLTATLLSGGNGRTAISTTGGNYLRSQKIVQLQPGVANATATYNATFYFTAAELAAWPSAEVPQLRIMKVNEGVDLSGTLSPGDYQISVLSVDSGGTGSSKYYSFTGAFTGFSKFMLVSPTATLPAHLVNFDALAEKKQILLTWKTASEQANKGFGVERSVNSSQFVPIGWVKGAGTTTAETSYRFIDASVKTNTTYQYRLKQVDDDNKSKISEIRQARLAGEDNILVTISPNPVKNRMRVSVAGNSQPVSLSLVNSKGQYVASWKNVTVTAGFEADVSGFSKGHYTLIAHLPGGDKSVPVIIQ